MECRKCKTDLFIRNIKIYIYAYGNIDERLNIVIECPECGNCINYFVPVSSFIDLD